MLHDFATMELSRLCDDYGKTGVIAPVFHCFRQIVSVYMENLADSPRHRFSMVTYASVAP